MMGRKVTGSRLLCLSNWKYFYLNEKEGHFKIWRGKWKEALARTSPKILFDYNSVTPIISSSSENNGVDNFVKESEREEIELNPKNSITIANNGSVGETFFQSLEFQATSDVTILELVNQELNEYTALFVATALNLGAVKYSYGRMRSLQEIKKEKILLPINKNKEIDWEYIEDFMKNLYENVTVGIEKDLESIENKVIWRIVGDVKE